ncbi:MAG: Rnf-Nqr domain containing protein [Pseudohongiellaceae bacterium]
MTDTIGLIVASALVNNIVLVQLLGVSAASLGSNRIAAALDLALFSGILLIASATVNTLLFWFLLQPLSLEALNLITFVSVCAFLSTLLAQWIKKNLPLSFRQHTLALYLAGANSAVIGVSLQHSQLPLSLGNFTSSVASSLGAALGFGFVIVAFSTLRLRLSTADTPEAFRGAPTLLISAGIAAMSFLGFAGLL